MGGFRTIGLYIIILGSMLLFGCLTMPYREMDYVTNGDYTSYFFGTGSETTLLIYLEGSGLNSVLGIKKGRVWQEVQFAYFVTKFRPQNVAVFVPEKLYFTEGKSHLNDRTASALYTVPNLISCYGEQIDCYLREHDYSRIILFGISEGGLLAPALYNSLESRDRISEMIIWGAGGLSQDECFAILGKSEINMPEGYRKACLAIDEIKERVKENPLATDKWYLGWPYARWSSFFAYTPLNEYRDIEIPVHFIQGRLDYQSPVESVEYIERELGSDNFTFHYYEAMGHIPESEVEIKAILDMVYSKEEGANK
jgi:hypothetical protein